MVELRMIIIHDHDHRFRKILIKVNICGKCSLKENLIVEHLWS